MSPVTLVKAHPVLTRHSGSHCGQQKEEEALVQLIIFYSFATLRKHESTWKVLPYVTINQRQATQIRGEEEQSTHQGPLVRPWGSSSKMWNATPSQNSTCCCFWLEASIYLKRSVNRRTVKGWDYHVCIWQQESGNLRVIEPKSLTELLWDLCTEFKPTANLTIHDMKLDTKMWRLLPLRNPTIILWSWSFLSPLLPSWDSKKSSLQVGKTTMLNMFISLHATFQQQ